VAKAQTQQARAMNIGDRIVTAEVLREDAEGWVYLLTRACAVSSEKPGCKVALLAKNREVRRKRHTIERGKPERLIWSDESAILASRFLT
jgi:hypothetical protein